MIIRTSKKKIDKYFNTDALNQSKLKTLINGLYSLISKDDEKKMYYEEKGHFVIGSGVDIWITQGYEEFEKQFFTLDIQKPSDALMSISHRIVDSLSSDFTGNTYSIPNDVYLKFIRKENYQNRFSDEKVVEVVRNKTNDYIDALIAARGKQICTKEEYDLISKIATNFMNLNPTKIIFDPELRLYTEKNKYDILYQVPIYFDVNGVKCKALIDAVKIDYDNKIVTPFDIKTVGDYVYNFHKSIKRNNYLFQAGFYHLALVKDRHKTLSSIVKKDISEFTINPFVFAVESTIYPKQPIFVRVSTLEIKNTIYGVPELNIGNINRKITFNKQRGILNYIDEYKFYLEKGFNIPEMMWNSSNVLTYENGILK